MRWGVLGLLVLIWVLAVVSACAPASKLLIQQHQEMAETKGFDARYIKGDSFTLFTLASNASAQNLGASNEESSRSATIYLEGDGQAWINRKRVSLNPTPKRPIGMLLAAEDRSKHRIFYIASACQFLMKGEDPSCTEKYWTSHRYSSEVIGNMNSVIDDLKKTYNIETLHLVGFSGGAAVALLTSAIRNDVKSIRTVAGNLNTDLFTEYHNVSLMTGSLNPTHFAHQLADIPQIHFVGSNDKVVPARIAQSFVGSLGASSCAQIRIIQNVSHQDGWVENWSKLTTVNAVCDILGAY